jgi:hypothetical protein
MRTGVLSDQSVRRFCKTIERDESTAPLAHRLLATRGNRQQFAMRLAEATYTPEQLAVLSPRMYVAMFERAAHVLTAPEGEEWEGYESEGDGSEWEGFTDYDDLEGEGEEEETFDDAAPFQFEPLTPSAPGYSTDPLTPASSSRRRIYSMKSTFSTFRNLPPCLLVNGWSSTTRKLRTIFHSRVNLPQQRSSAAPPSCGPPELGRA